MELAEFSHDLERTPARAKRSRPRPAGERPTAPRMAPRWRLALNPWKDKGELDADGDGRELEQDEWEAYIRGGRICAPEDVFQAVEPEGAPLWPNHGGRGKPVVGYMDAVVEQGGTREDAIAQYISRKELGDDSWEAYDVEDDETCTRDELGRWVRICDGNIAHEVETRDEWLEFETERAEQYWRHAEGRRTARAVAMRAAESGRSVWAEADTAIAQAADPRSAVDGRGEVNEWVEQVNATLLWQLKREGGLECDAELVMHLKGYAERVVEGARRRWRAAAERPLAARDAPRRRGMPEYRVDRERPAAGEEPTDRSRILWADG